MQQQNGILVLNKPQGITSAFAIAKIKRLGQKKIGHAGTLDPMATGVLLVLLGQATKLSNYLLEQGQKTYEGELELGITTDTWDKEGEILEKKDFAFLSHYDIEKEVLHWLESKSQIVPPYSAAKHQGKPLYSLARQGKEVPVKTKNIHISYAQVLEIHLPYVKFRVTCSSGSYIRSLAHSLGQRLSCGATLTGLTRTYSHPFDISQALLLDEILEEPNLLLSRIFSLQEALPSWACITCDTATMQDIQQGRLIPHQDNFLSHSLPHEHAVEIGTKALFQNEEGIPLALMQYELKENRPYWAVLRGLWA